MAIKLGDVELTQEQVEALRMSPFDHWAIQEAMDLAIRDALLEHARMGRSVCEGRDGKVVWFTPAEIFARYGFDEFGRPLPASAPGA